MKHLRWLLAFIFLWAAKASGQTPAELKSYLPELPGWTLAEETEVFDPDNLFDRINGAAPLFIENHFQEMTSMEYTQGDQYITIQVYRHATPEDAFGMYASERSSDLNFVPVGGEGQGDNSNLFFFSGPVYVKMWTNSTEDLSGTLRQIGRQLADKVDAGAAYPATVKAFPAQGQQPYSMAYITSNYIGHEFLHSVYTARYDLNGQPVQAFILDGGTTEGAKKVLSDYFTFTKQPQEFSEGDLLIKDRYNGDIPVIWKGRYIIGLFNENGDPVENGETLMKQIAASL